MDPRRGIRQTELLNPERSVATRAKSRLKSWFPKSLSGLRKPTFFIINYFCGSISEI
jgi:hypothetical protein